MQRPTLPARLGALAAAALVSLLGFPAPAGANHPQSDSGRTVAFDHVTGNEWWVEVALSGQDAGSVASVEAQDTNGPWVALTKRSWGPYAASFHIEPGHQVRFRATWTGGAQQVSCWFTHPAGAEQCAVPPAGWQLRSMGDVAGAEGAADVAVGDATEDGSPDVFVPTGNGLLMFQWTSEGWKRSVVTDLWWYDHAAVADLDGNGLGELYASHGNGVDRFNFDGRGWERWNLFWDSGGRSVGDLAVGDADGDGRQDLYFGLIADDGPVYQLRLLPDGGYEHRIIGFSQGGTNKLWVGNGDLDADDEVYVGMGNRGMDNVWRIEFEGDGSFSGTLVHDGPTTGSVSGIVAGDADGNGVGEILSALPGLRAVVRHVPVNAGNWQSTQVATLPGGAWPTDLAFGDGDNDGSREAYVASSDGNVHRLKWTGSAWSLTTLLDAGGGETLALALGDGDGDGLRELHASTVPTAGTCCANPMVAQVADHPPAPRPPPGWHVSLAGVVDGSSDGDMAVGDGDRDGKREVYVAAPDGLWQLKWTGARWQETLVGAGTMRRVAVGDGDGDGRPEVYAARWTSGSAHEVVRFAPDGSGGWSLSTVFGVGRPIGTLTLGDVDDDGRVELYAALAPETSLDGELAVYQLHFQGGWQVRFLGTVWHGAIDSWVADGDRDGDRELYLVNDGVWRVDISGGSGVVTQISPDIPEDEGHFTGIVAGDGDRDGLGEVYVSVSAWGADDDAIRRYSARPDGWSLTTIALPDLAPWDLALGDADNDGAQELWFPSFFDGALHQVRWTGSAWAHKRIADPGPDHGVGLVLGDADNDGKLEAYLEGFTGGRGPVSNIFRLGQVPPPVSFDATFTGVRGNEWWVQANVAAAGGTLARVDVRLNGGEWKPLTPQSWGGWAASYRIVQGTQVQFRATSTAGATDLSDCYAWIPPSNGDAARVACSQPPPPGFDATFSGAKGNEWWVQVNVAANQPLAGVEARVNCGPTWVALSLQSWGGWARSFHVPNGSKVDFRATSTQGGSDLSGGYVWPSATPTSAC